MEFESSDWDWSDWHDGLTPERRERFVQVLDEIERRLRIILTDYKFDALVPGGIFSTGVQGDKRTYALIVVLFGPWPGYQVLEEVSAQITNTMPVNRVVYHLAGAGYKSPFDGEPSE